MKFLLCILDDATNQPTPEALQRIVGEHDQYVGALVAAGKLAGGNRLRPEFQKITVQNGKRVATDGPFAETKEILGGYYLLECDSHQEALEWAKRCPMFPTDSLQLFPIWE